MTENITKGDESLLTGPFLPLTPAFLEEIQRGIAAHERRYAEEFPKLLAECPYETKLAVACWVMKAIYEHAKEGGSYRYLIYERLGFGPDAYAPCMFAHGLDISNEFEIVTPSSDDQEHIRALKEAADELPAGDKRYRLLSAYLRFEALSALAQAASRIIEAQRAEFAALMKGGHGGDDAAK